MRRLFTIILFFALSFIYADIDCPADSAYHTDNRTMLPDGSPNPTYGQEISTGLCVCLGFIDGASLDGNLLTFTIRVVDNEPIRGLELDIYHDNSDLEYHGYAKGEKLENVTDEEGVPRTMTLLGNYLDDHLKVLAYSTARARTNGDGQEGDLLHVTYSLVDGASLPDQVTFYFGLANIPGTSSDPELLNVVCSYPSESNPISVSTTTATAKTEKSDLIPEVFALKQNYPNPFNPSTQINFDVPSGSEFVSLNIYNLLGQNVRTLVSEILPAGRYTMEWDAKDMLENPVSSGIYFYELKSQSFVSRKKMLLIR